MNISPAARPFHDRFRTIAVDVHGRDYYEAVSRLAVALEDLPPARRGELAYRALSFTPDERWEEEMTVGYIRALLSDCLERLLEGPVPILKLRDLCAKTEATTIKRCDAMLRETTVVGVHLFMMEIACALLQLARSRDAASNHRQRPSDQRTSETSAVDFIARVWPSLAPHVRDAVMTLLTAAAAVVDSDFDRGSHDL
ncbi:hypothetical protein OAS39_02185 [Pirellulales bacterium]|nr:hypothetical protein [Pirellulales bacterium]